MRERLNNNPMVQVGVLGLLILAAAFFFITTMSGGGEEESASTTATAGVEGTEATATEGTAEVPVATTAEGVSAVAAPPPPGALAAAAPPPPANVVSAYNSGKTVVLLFVRNRSIDDLFTALATARLHSMPGTTVFIVPAKHIARYARITQGVEVTRVPALVVLRPKRLDNGVPTASLHLGFQSPESVEQAVIDAGYKGKTVDYHP